SDWYFTEVNLPNLHNLRIICNQTETLAQNNRLGRFQPALHESHSSARGQVRQFAYGTITIYDGKWPAMAGWPCNGTPSLQCQTRRNTFITNVVRHELGHSMGLGHKTSTGGLNLMDLSFNDINPNSTPWQQGLMPTSSEQTAI